MNVHKKHRWRNYWNIAFRTEPYRDLCCVALMHIGLQIAWDINFTQVIFSMWNAMESQKVVDGQVHWITMETLWKRPNEQVRPSKKSFWMSSNGNCCAFLIVFNGFNALNVKWFQCNAFWNVTVSLRKECISFCVRFTFGMALPTIDDVSFLVKWLTGPKRRIVFAVCCLLLVALSFALKAC